MVPSPVGGSAGQVGDRVRITIDHTGLRQPAQEHPAPGHPPQPPISPSHPPPASRQRPQPPDAPPRDPEPPEARPESPTPTPPTRVRRRGARPGDRATTSAMPATT